MMPSSRDRRPGKQVKAIPLPSYKKGGTVKKTGLALVHKGEKVIPKGRKNKK